MARRRPHSDTPLDQKQQELAQRENDLRKQMDDLQRMIEEAPRVAEEKTRREREELFERATSGGHRLDVTMALQDKRYSELRRRTAGRPRHAQTTQRRPSSFSRPSHRAFDRDHLDRDRISFLFNEIRAGRT